MEIHRQHAVGAGGGDEVGDQLGRDRRARPGFAVLPGIAEIGDDRGDPLGRRAPQRIDADQQFHEIVVGREAGRLDHEHVLAADILVDLDEHFLVGEAAHAGLGQRHFEIIGDRPGQRQVRVAGEQFHWLASCPARAATALRQAQPPKGRLRADNAGHKPSPVTERLTHRPRPDEPARRRPRRQCRGDARRPAKAAAEGADLVVFPELQLTGYPPEDLVLKPEFVRRTMEATERLVDATADGGPAMLFGTLHRRGRRGLQCDDPRRGRAHRRADAQARTAQLRHLRRKARLRRRPAAASRSSGAGVKLGVPICEDIWLDRCAARISPRPGPNCCWSPTAARTRSTRTTCATRWCATASLETGLPLAYLNRVGGQDELAFDGSSFVINDDGDDRRPDARLGRAAAADRLGTRRPTAGAATRDSLAPLDPFPEDIYHAMMVALARLCRPQRLPRRDPRPVGRDRQRAVGGGRGRRARRRQGVVRDAAVQIYHATKASRTPRQCARTARGAAMTSSRSPRRSTRSAQMLPDVERASPPRISSRGCGW